MAKAKKRKPAGSRFAKIPVWVLDLDLARIAIRAYAALAYKAANPDRVCTASALEIMLFARIAPTRKADFFAAVAKLEELGAVIVERRPGKKNTYRLPLTRTEADPKGWVRLPNFVMEDLERLDGTDVCVYLAIARYRNSRDWLANPGIKTIMAMARCTKAAAMTSIAALDAAGALHVQEGWFARRHVFLLPDEHLEAGRREGRRQVAAAVYAGRAGWTPDAGAPARILARLEDGKTPKKKWRGKRAQEPAASADVPDTPEARPAAPAGDANPLPAMAYRPRGREARIDAEIQEAVLRNPPPPRPGPR